MSKHSLLIPILVAVPSALHAQQAPLWSNTGFTMPFPAKSLAVLADYNGNGTDDVAICDNSTLRIVDGNGTLLATHATQAFSVDRVDWDQNGVDDVIVGSQMTSIGEVLVFLAGTPQGAAPITGQFFANNVTGVRMLGDLQGDGFPDVAVTQFTSPNLQIFSVETLTFGGSTPHRVHPVGVSVESLGDFNGDGTAEYAIGTAFAGVDVFDGASGTMLFNLVEGSMIDFGATIQNLGDVDSDGFDDIAIADVSQGTVFVVSGAGLNSITPTGGTTLLTPAMTLYTLQADDHRQAGGTQSTSDAFGFSISSTGDIDGDGAPDFIVGNYLTERTDPDDNDNPDALPGVGTWPQLNVIPPGANTGVVRLVSGATGTTIKQFFSPAANHFGIQVAGGGDLDNDGIPDFVAADSNGSSSDVTVAFSGNVEIGAVFGPGVPNSTGNVGTATGRGSQAAAANSLTIEFRNLPVGAFGYMIMSPKQRPNPVVIGSGINYLGNPLFRFPGVFVGASGGVDYTVDLSVPAGGTLPFDPFTRWNFQFYHRDLGPTENLSEALTIGLY
ncbi:MAG: VCBS repeat-containing protein [Planctomycetes bacterium]|nr:VCBS repeat-containing protein [Planctomycetota bacterium]